MAIDKIIDNARHPANYDILLKQFRHSSVHCLWNGALFIEIVSYFVYGLGADLVCPKKLFKIQRVHFQNVLVANRIGRDFFVMNAQH